MSNLPDYYNKAIAENRPYRDYLETILKNNTNRQISANTLLAGEIKSTLIDNQIATEKALFNHTQQIDGTLTAGFSDVSRQLGAIGSAMNMSFSFLNSAIGESSKAICDKLDNINETLKHPKLVAARESYETALNSYNKGYYQEALEDLQEAVKNNKTEPLIYFLMGQTYLRGISEFSNAVDLDKAIEAFGKAATYIARDAADYPEVKPMAAEICFYLGLAHYTKAIDSFHNKSNLLDYSGHLAEAKGAYKKSCDYSQKMLESRYNLARCQMLTGKTDEAISDLNTVMMNNHGYCIRFFTESDFGNEFKEAFFTQLKCKLYPELEGLFIRIKYLRNAFDGPYSAELKQLIKMHLPGMFTQNTPPFDMLEANEYFPKILSFLEKEKEKYENECRKCRELERQQQIWQEEKRIDDERRKKQKLIDDEQKRIAHEEILERERKQEQKKKRTYILFDSLIVLALSSALMVFFQEGSFFAKILVLIIHMLPFGIIFYFGGIIKVFSVILMIACFFWNRYLFNVSLNHINDSTTLEIFTGTVFIVGNLLSCFIMGIFKILGCDDWL